MVHSMMQLDEHFRRSWDGQVHLEFSDRFPVGEVAVRDLCVLVYNRSFSLFEFRYLILINKGE
jgi:hypothetical protein